MHAVPELFVLTYIRGERYVSIEDYFSPANLFLASSTSTIPGSASFQRERNFYS